MFSLFCVLLRALFCELLEVLESLRALFCELLLDDFFLSLSALLSLNALTPERTRTLH